MRFGFEKISSEVGVGFVINHQNKVVRTWVGSNNSSRAFKSLGEFFPNLVRTGPNSDLPEVIRSQVAAFISGEKTNFSRIPHQLIGDFSPLQKAVYQELKKVPPGRLITYDELGARTGLPYSPRAIGQIVGKNPLPMVIPCHRVLGKASAGGFSADGGVKTKQNLIELEGETLNQFELKSIFDRNFSLKRATSEFLKIAPEFKPLVSVEPPFEPADKQPIPVFKSLSKSVIFQQLSTKAATTIFNRTIAIQARGHSLDPKWVLKTSEKTLKNCGLSLNKLKTIKNLAELELANQLPTLKEMRRTPNFSLINKLSAIKGIGPWTVEMYLIFGLGRLDIFSTGDLGLKKGYEKLTGKTISSDLEFARETLKWSPYRSLASWYLWRLVD